MPAVLRGVDVEEHLNARLPLEIPFTDEKGMRVPLARHVATGRPVVLYLGYYRCPMLCDKVLDGVIQALRATRLAPGRDFEVVTVSIDPRETPALARAKKQAYVRSWGVEGASQGWHALTGEAPAIATLARALGFRYTYDSQQEQYAHPAVFYVVTPEGRIARYHYGVLYDPSTVRLSIIEASEGRAGTSLDRLILACYHYDPATGTYAPAAIKLMRIGGVLTVLLLGTALSILWVRDMRRHRTA